MKVMSGGLPVDISEKMEFMRYIWKMRGIPRMKMNNCQCFALRNRFIMMFLVWH